MPEYYTYSYRFYEPKAGEFKDHQEFRNGRLIHGSLKVMEKTGAQTNITYEGLPWSGWQALIETGDSSDPQVASPRSSTLAQTKLTIEMDFSGRETSQTITSQAFKPTRAVVFVPSAELSVAKSSSKAATTGTTFKPKSAEVTTKPKSSQTKSSQTMLAATLAPKNSRIGGRMQSEPWLQVYRLGPSNETLLNMIHNLHEVTPSWHNRDYPARTRDNCLSSPYRTFRPTEGGALTDPYFLPMLNQHFRWSAQHPHRQLYDQRIKTETTGTQRRQDSITHEQTAWSPRFHSHFRIRRHNVYRRLRPLADKFRIKQ